MYDISSRGSFAEVDSFLNAIERCRGGLYTCILVG